VADHLSPPLAKRLRGQTAEVRDGDHWPDIVALDHDRLLSILMSESIEVCAVVLSKLPVGTAAALVAEVPGERARRMTYAMSQTASISPEAVQRIGRALAADYGDPPPIAFDKAPVQRLGAILNESGREARDGLLEQLEQTDQEFAQNVRKVIFTFKDIAARVKDTDIPAILRSIDPPVLTRAIGAAMQVDEQHAASAEHILSSLTQRMAGQIREDAADLGTIKPADGEAAMTEVTRAIREQIDAGIITLNDPDTDWED
jgi:flagellar motor switch protein FliG